MIRRLCLAALALSLAGCQNLSRPSEADLAETARHMPTEKDILARFDDVAGMYRDICTAPEYEPYFTKTPCLPPLATKRQLADKTKITPQEAEAMQGVLREVRTLNNETRSLMRKSGIDSYVARADHARDIIDPAVEENQNALLTRTITWGEYNRRRIELASLSADDAVEFEGITIPLDHNNH